jgi:uncharacterized membrane protein
MRFSISTGSLKFTIGWVAVFLFRLIPFRPPNFEPMLATVMPFSKRYGLWGSFAFGFFGIVLYDAITSGWGSWTLVTAICYGLLGIAAHYFFRNRATTISNFLAFGIPATVAYDAVTMLIGPVFNHQSFTLALAGQVPFTLMHLAGTITFSVLLSPALYRWVIENDAFEFFLPPSIRQARIIHRG